MRRCNRCGEDNLLRRLDEFEFLNLERKFRFLLRTFTGGNLFAEAARVPPVESLFNRRCQRAMVQIARQHRCPRDGLQYGPMGAGGGDQRENQQDIANPGKHAATLAQSRSGVKSANRASQRTVPVSEP